ncbi:MAG: alpha/beta fold hydrolase [Pseudomonadota bacterium]
MAKDIDKFVIEQLYDVASSPYNYDEFMRSLEAEMASIKEMTDAGASDQLQSHLDRAYGLVDVVTPWPNDGQSALENIPHISIQPMIAANYEGRIVDANHAARVMYDLTPDSQLSGLPLDSHEIKKLHAMTKDVITGRDERNSPNDIIRFHNMTTERPMLITLSPFIQKAGERALAIIKTSDSTWPSHLGPILTDLFELSPAEIEVLRLLVTGETVDNIAKTRQNSIATVRTQLRSIYAKTDTKSQIECIRLTLGLALMHSTEEGRAVAHRIEASRDKRAYPREEDRAVLQLKNGRDIEYSVFGAPDGQTILFCHDQVLGDTWFCDAVEDATREGFKIIIPLRPGFGRTTVYKGRCSDPRKFAPDVAELLDYLNIKRLSVIAMRGGLVHGLALASLLPETVASVTVGNPILPVLCEADIEGTNGYNRLIPQTRLHFPQALKFLVKTGFAYVTAKGPEAFVTAVLRASPKDVEWASRPDIMPVLVKGLVVHRKHGYKASYGDIAYAEDWSDLLADCPVPIQMAIGEHDRNVQWGAAKRWAAAYDHIKLTVLPDSGYLVFYQHNQQILTLAKDDVGKYG